VGIQAALQKLNLYGKLLISQKTMYINSFSYFSIYKKNDKVNAEQGVWIVTSYPTVKELIECNLDNSTVTVSNAFRFTP
jgi:hypothetical protein